MEVNQEKIDQINEKSDYFKDVLQRIPGWVVTWGNSVALIVLVLMMAGLWFIKYPDTITCTSVVSTETPSIEVHSKSSSRIQQILKKEGDRVYYKEWIIILENSSNFKDVKKLIQQLKTIDSSDFWKEIDTFDEESKGDFILGDINEPYSAFLRNISEYKLFQKLTPQFNQININKRRGKNITSIIERLNNQKKIYEEELMLAEKDLSRVKRLFEKKYSSEIEVEQKQLIVLNNKNKLEDINRTILTTKLDKETVNKENANLLVEKNDDYFRLRTNILQSFSDLKFQLKQWQGNYVLESPLDGVINFFEFRSEQQFLAAQQKVFTITPQKKSTYFAFLNMPLSNSGKVKVNNEVIIRLQNYPDSEFGMLRGVVQSISMVPKDGFYSVKVELPNQLVTTTKRSLETRFQYSGSAEIITADLSLFDRFFNFFRTKMN